MNKYVYFIIYEYSSLIVTHINCVRFIGLGLVSFVWMYVKMYIHESVYSNYFSNWTFTQNTEICNTKGAFTFCVSDKLIDTLEYICSRSTQHFIKEPFLAAEEKEEVQKSSVSSMQKHDSIYGPA